LVASETAATEALKRVENTEPKRVVIYNKAEIGERK
jgi:hypothetical protein